MCHEERQITGRLADGNAVSPKHDWCHQNPFGMVIVASLHEGLADVKMFLLYEAICLRVVRGNLDVMNAIFLGKVTHGSNKSRSIVHHNFRDTSPSAKNPLKNEVPKGFLIFLPEGLPLWPGR